MMLAFNRIEHPDPVVICTQPPYIWAKVWRYKDPHEFINFFTNYKGLGKAAVPGYNICLTFGGSLTGNVLQNIGPDIADTIDRILQEMVQFYIEERIEDRKSFYKKFKISK